MDITQKTDRRRAAFLGKALFLLPFFGYIMIVWLSVKHSARICIEKRQRYDTKLLNDFLVNGTDALPNNITTEDLVSNLKPSIKKIRGDRVNASFQDYRQYLLEPIIDFNLIQPNTLFVFVQSACHNYKKRKRIRETWGNRAEYKNYGYNPIYVIFTIGIPLNVFLSNTTNDILNAVLMEATTTRDILLLNMVDIYDNLTTKGFLSMFWIASHGAKIKYILKTDDDVLLNTFAWFRVVEKIRSHDVECVIIGCIWSNPPVFRSGKYVVSEMEYSYDRFPSFSSGSGYLMTRASMVTILEAAMNLPFLTRDDPFFAGIIPRLTGIPMISLPHSSYMVDDGPMSADYMEKRGIMVVHNPTSQMWTIGWNLFIKHKKYGYPKSYKTVLLMSKNRGSKYAIPIMMYGASDRKTPLPSQWTLPDNACLTNKCNTVLSKIHWQIPA